MFVEICSTRLTTALRRPEGIWANDSNLGAQENNGLFNPTNSDIDGILRLNEALICHDDSLSSLEISSISHNVANNEDSSNKNAEDKFKHPKFVLSELKGKHTGKLIIAHININHIQNKFEHLVSIVRNKVAILVISETEIDDSYPTNQFLWKDILHPLRLDRNTLNICKSRHTMQGT